MKPKYPPKEREVERKRVVRRKGYKIIFAEAKEQSASFPPAALFGLNFNPNSGRGAERSGRNLSYRKDSRESPEEPVPDTHANF